MGRVVIAGGSGWIGSALAERLTESGREVAILTRTPDGPNEIGWDGESHGPWAGSLDGAEAVVNLTGAPITLPWTPKNRKKILDSRVKSTEAIGVALHRCKLPPAVWINGSATGFYGDREDETLDESSPAGDGFLSDVCQAWEAAQGGFQVPGVRLVRIRTGVVLGPEGGALDAWEKLTRFFLGGAQGDGKQWLPWIHLEDLVELFVWTMEEPVSGVFNGTAPNPVRNGRFMRQLRQVIGRPWSPPAPEFALKIVAKLGGPDPDILLDSCRAVPRRAPESGFPYRFGTTGEALRDLFEYEGAIADDC